MVLLLMWVLAAPADTAALEARMLALVNVERAARGLAPLELEPALTAVAREYSRLMAATGRVDHARDRPMEERIAEATPNTCGFGENVSKNTSVDYALSDLMTSEGHRANLLNPRYVTTGIGIVRGTSGELYITQEFARPCEPRLSR